MSTTLSPAATADNRAARSRARKAALGSFVGAVVDWYDFLLYGIVAALVFNAGFFPKVSPAMGTLAASPRSASAFWSGRSAASCSAISATGLAASACWFSL
jgi:hypothetical protein